MKLIDSPEMEISKVAVKNLPNQRMESKGNLFLVDFSQLEPLCGNKPARPRV